MNQHSISSRKLNRYMERLLDLAGASNFIQFSRNDSAFADPDFLKALRLLESAEEISCKYPMWSILPYAVYILPKGRLHFYALSQQRAGFIRGFLSGLIIGLLPVILQFILSMLSQ